MNRDLMIIISVVGFCAGCLALFYSVKLPSLTVCIYLLICAGLLIGLAPKHYFSVVLLACCIGFVWSAYQAQRIMRWQLALEEINRPVIITGRISTLPQSDPLGVHFEFQLSKFANKKAIDDDSFKLVR